MNQFTKRGWKQHSLWFDPDNWKALVDHAKYLKVPLSQALSAVLWDYAELTQPRKK